MTKIKSSNLGNTVIDFINTSVSSNVSSAVSSAVASAVTTSFANITVGQVEPRISNLIITDSTYTNTANVIGTAGGFVRILGSGFFSNTAVLFNNSNVPSYSYISASEIRAQLPGATSGSYILNIANYDGASAFKLISVVEPPVWVTSSTLPSQLNPLTISIQLSATGQGAILYSFESGSLPIGITLSSSGLISGNYTIIGTSADYTFTVRATDLITGLSRSRVFVLPIVEAYATGQIAYTSPGTYSWIAPANVFRVSAVCIGAGGAGSHGWGNSGQGRDGGAGGGGGGLGWKNNISVIPGQSYTVFVGSGGSDTSGGLNGNGTSGTDSYFINLTTVLGGGGGAATGNTGGAGGVYVGDGGAAGGKGGDSTGGFSGGGGGGAAGYTGAGGAGGNSGVTGSNGSGGGAGGAGGNGGAGNYWACGAGGGVGILGQGSNGTGGDVGAYSIGGNGGSGGAKGGDGYDAGSGRNSRGGNGGAYGGGGGGGIFQYDSSLGGSGAGGAVRIIWGVQQGIPRAFPSTGTADV